MVCHVERSLLLSNGKLAAEGLMQNSLPQRLWALGGHLEEGRVGELLDVVAVGETIFAEKTAVVPERLAGLLTASCCQDLCFRIADPIT